MCTLLGLLNLLFRKVLIRQNIVNGELRNESDANLLAKEHLEISFNRRLYNRRLVYAGSTQKSVNAYIKTLDSPNNGNLEVISVEPDEIAGTSKKQKLKAHFASELDKTIIAIESSKTNSNPAATSSNSLVGNPPADIDQTGDSTADDVTTELKKKLEKSKRKNKKLKAELEEQQQLCQKYKTKTKNLLRKLKTVEENKKTTIDIGNGVVVNSALLERTKIFSSSPAILARNVFRLVFTDDEIKGKSLFGRACNANKHIQAKPSVDQLKRDSVINYCVTYLEQDSKNSGGNFEKNLTRSKIAKSLGEYIREVDSKLAKGNFEGEDVGDVSS